MVFWEERRNNILVGKLSLSFIKAFLQVSRPYFSTRVMSDTWCVGVQKVYSYVVARLLYNIAAFYGTLVRC